jgi:hypothetical protein
VKLTTDLSLVPRSRIVELYLHSPIFLHGVVSNSAQGKLCVYITMPITVAAKCLRSLERSDRGFESYSRHGCVFAFILCLC